MAVGLAASVALADKTATLRSSDVKLDQVQIRAESLPDGGTEIVLTAWGHVRDETSGVGLNRVVTCSTVSLTAAQKTALATIQNASLACWRQSEGL